MNEQFSIKDKVVIVTGGYGALGSSISRHFASQGAKVVIVGRSEERGKLLEKEIRDKGGDALFIASDVLDVEKLRESKDVILGKYGRIDILINVAGGNVPGATLGVDQSVFEMKFADWDKVINLNLNGTIYPCLIFGEAMGKQNSGSIINISSMAALSAITRVPGYSAAKAAVTNFTEWMATEMALKHGDGIRVNAVAPGFFIGEQNRAVLINPDGSLTDRSHKIINNTPMKRFGDLTELNGAIQFLCSDAASFITGAVLPIDGGFSVFSGV